MTILTVLVVVASVAIAGIHLAQMAGIAAGARELRRRRQMTSEILREAAPGAGMLPGVSALVHATADTERLVRTLDALFAQPYPDLEVIVIVDGAATQALDVLSARVTLTPADPRPRHGVPCEHVRAIFVALDRDRLIVVDKRGADPADALNAGLNVATRPLVLAVAPDTTLGPHALIDAALPFAFDPATAASVSIAAPVELAAEQGGREGLAGIAALQRLRRRLAWLASSAGEGPRLAPPALALVSREVLLQHGGFEPCSPDPLRELILRLHGATDASGARRRSVEVDATAHASEPVGLSAWLAEEARRLQTTKLLHELHRETLASGGSAPMRALTPDTSLDLVAAVVEAVGWILVIVGVALGGITLQTALLFVSASLGLGLAVSLSTLIAEILVARAAPSAGRALEQAALAAAEQAGPRQLALWVRLRAQLSASRGAA